MTSMRLRGVAGQLVGLAWPLVIARSTQVAVGVSDALLVGHLGEASLAATSDGALIAFALLALPLGTASIVSTFASQFTGAGDPSGARRFGYYGVALALATEAALIALLPAIPWALGHLSHTPEVRTLMAGYLQMRLLSAGAAVGLDALANYYCGTGNTRLPMLVSLSALAFNILGNWLLIDGRWGLPAMGVTGSALASTLSTTLGFATLFIVFIGSRVHRRTELAALSTRELRRMLRVGLPVGANWFLEMSAFALFVNVFIAGFGTTVLAALMTVLQISAIMTLPGFALASAGAVVVGQAIGNGAYAAVPRLVRLTLVAAVLWQSILALVYGLFSRTLLLPFVREADNASALVEVGVRLLLLSAAWTLFEVMAATYAEALSAAGDTVITLWVRLLILCLIFAPVAWLLTHRKGAGFTDLILWFIACAALLVVILHRRFQSGAWRHIRIVQVAPRELATTAEV